MSTLDLTGLRANHPLGFLAACGLLRCATRWKKFGWVKLAWTRAEPDGHFATIHAELPLDVELVTQSLLRLSEEQRVSPAWTWSTKIDERTKFRDVSRSVLMQLGGGASRDAADMLASLASDLVSTGESLRPTSFDLTSGAQGLLRSFIEVATWSEVDKAQAGLKAALTRAKAEKVDKAQAGLKAALTRAEVEFGAALMGPWRYQDGHHSLGWDPQAQRIHALRGKLPEKDKENRSVRAAVFLATQALPLFPCFSVSGRLRTTGFHRDHDEDWLAWPIWREPISLDTLRSLLVQPFTADMKERGVEVVYRCQRARTGGSEGDYRVLSHPEERAWPVRRPRRSSRGFGR